MTDILLTTYFRWPFTEKVIKHIVERTKTPYRLIVIDNGSRDETPENLKKMEALGLVQKVILLPNNLGLQAAKNVALEYIESELFVNTDNDCLCPDLKPDWLEQMINLMNSYPEFAAISMRPQVLVGVGPIFKDAKEVVENNVAGGSFRIMRTALVREVGGWRDDFENRQEEWHICSKLRQKGYKVGYARDLFCYHMFEDKEKGLKNWGYPQEVSHYHNQASEIYAKDVEYDPISCEPYIRLNE